MRTIRRARREDIPALVTMRAQLFDASLDSSWRAACADWFESRISEFGIFIAVVEEGGEAVAMAIGAVRDTPPSPLNPRGGEIAISNVCTLPSAQGRGHATAAFAQVRTWAFETGIGQVHIVDPYAVSYQVREVNQHAVRMAHRRTTPA